MTPSERVALVTGGGRGIGRATVLELARRGLSVAVAARSLKEIEATAAAARELGVAALAVELDVASADSITQAIARISTELGPVDTLVNNAGIAPSAPLLKTTLETWEQTLRVNATGPLLCIQAVLPSMLERGFGRVVNVASTAARMGFRYTAAYTASKHALLGLTRVLAQETLGKGLAVNAVCPSYVRTELTEASARRIAEKTGISADDAMSSLAKMNPDGRLLEPEEVAQVIGFLATEAPVSLTGQAINVDAGAVQS